MMDGGEHGVLLSLVGAPRRRRGVLVQVAQVRGTLDATTDETFLAAVRAVGDHLCSRVASATGRRAGGRRAVLLLDLDGVSWCDSRGLGALVRAVTAGTRRGVSLRLAAAEGTPASRIVTRVAMAEVLALAPSVDDVLAGLHPSPLEVELDP